jgi:uncharacterized membrane protein (UPF0127 family)
VFGIAAAVLGGLLLRSSGDDGRASFNLSRTKPAAAPFAAFSEARAAVGKRCLRVLVASSAAQRSQGLRDVTSLGDYDAMVFVFPNDTVARFTMAQTRIPLDVGWYGADGVPIERTRMTPCPDGTDATCPTYGPKRRYRYAVETSAGQLGGGGLTGC